MYSVTGSEYCSVDADTVLYHWQFSQFASLERYTDFCHDREKWSQKGEEQDRRLQEALNKHKQRRGK